jgi:hypothetical protein
VTFPPSFELPGNILILSPSLKTPVKTIRVSGDSGIFAMIEMLPIIPKTEEFRGLPFKVRLISL